MAEPSNEANKDREDTLKYEDFSEMKECKWLTHRIEQDQETSILHIQNYISALKRLPIAGTKPIEIKLERTENIEEGTRAAHWTIMVHIYVSGTTVSVAGEGSEFTEALSDLERKLKAEKTEWVKNRDAATKAKEAKQQQG